MSTPELERTAPELPGIIRAFLDRAAGHTQLRLLLCGSAVRNMQAMQTEAESGEQPAAVLHAIASGKTRHNEIKDWVRAEPSRTLDRLIDLRLVDRLVPVTEDPVRSRRRLYRIADNFMAFHLGLVSRYRDDIERGLGASILNVMLASLDDHLGYPWEDAVRRFVRRECAVGKLAPDVVAVGPWWTAEGQDKIDVLALTGRARTPALAGEAKWAQTVNAPPLVNALRRKVAVTKADPESLRYLVAARKRVTSAGPDTTAITAADVFRPQPPGV